MKFFVMDSDLMALIEIYSNISGDSCAAGSRDSAFIATTSSLSETYSIARQYYSGSRFRGTLYRYRIRANNIFYSIQPSVNYLTVVELLFRDLRR